MAKIEFTKKDLERHWGISRNCLNALLAGGILSEPFNKNQFEILPDGKKRFHHPRFTTRQVQAAEQPIEELARPTPNRANPRTTRGLSEKQKAEMRAWAGLK